jgi:hypothetical protein
MDFILRHLNTRGFLFMGGCVALFVLAIRFHDVPGRWYEARMIARDRGAAPPASDIAQDLDARESLRLKGLYRDVSAEIAAAKARGVKTEQLQRAADAALGLNTPASRKLAFENLNRLRPVIPQSLDALRPAGGGDEPSDAPPTPTSAPARRKRSR